LKKNRNNDQTVEINKSAFKKNKQDSKSPSNYDIIKQDKNSCDDDENRNPDHDTESERMESISTINEDKIKGDDDAVQVYRDVLSMTDDDRNAEDGGDSFSIKLSPPPPPSWTDDPSKMKFKTGDFVRYKGYPNSDVYKVCGPCKEENTYRIKLSKSQYDREEIGDNLVKVTDKSVVWVDYWKANPVISAPKPWLKKNEAVKKNKK
jgi:hypothetical protein